MTQRPAALQLSPAASKKRNKPAKSFFLVDL